MRFLSLLSLAAAVGYVQSRVSQPNGKLVDQPNGKIFIDSATGTEIEVTDAGGSFGQGQITIEDVINVSGDIGGGQTSGDVENLQGVTHGWEIEFATGGIPAVTPDVIQLAWNAVSSYALQEGWNAFSFDVRQAGTSIILAVIGFGLTSGFRKRGETNVLSQVSSVTLDNGTTISLPLVPEFNTLSCSGDHLAPIQDCINLITSIRTSDEAIPLDPQCIQVGNCFISWNKKVSGIKAFLYNAAVAELNTCGDQHGATVSAHADGVLLGSTSSVEQCLSNRCSGCN